MEKAVSPTAEPTPRRASTIALIFRSPGFHGLVGVAVLGWLLVEGIQWLGGPEAIRARYGMSAAVLAVPVQAVVAVSPVPSEIIALANSAVYGLWLGSILNWLAWMLAAFLEYALFRRVVADADPRESMARLPAWLRRFPVDHPLFLICARYLPWGSHIVNGLAGAHGISLVRFTWTTAVALVPISIALSALANGLVKIT